MKGNAALRRTRWNKRIFLMVMMAPAIVSFLVFYVYVNFNSILMAFQEPLAGGEYKWGFGNFSGFFNELGGTDSLFMSSISNTAIFFLTGYIGLILSLLLCYFIYKKVWGYKVFRFVFYLPNIIMGTVTVSLFKYIIEIGGPIDRMIQIMGGDGIPLLLADSRYAIWTLVFYNLFFGLGGNMILLSGAMTSISNEVIEAARLDGVSWVREMFQIVIPLIWPTLQVMLLTSVVGITTASGPILLFTQGRFDTYTISYWIYEQVLNSAQLEMASAVGLMCTVITFPIAWCVKTLLNKVSDKIGV